MKTVELTLYKLTELSEKAQQKAHETWLRHSDSFDHDAEWVIEEAKTIGELMGIEIERVYYRGFSSQGDGACFEGYYAYKAGGLKAIIEYAPKDKELHAIAANLQDIQKRAFYSLTANVKQRGHYMHENCTVIDVHNTRDRWENCTETQEEGISEFLRDFMRWIYRQLENAYDGYCSFEYFKEECESNEWTFEANGRMNNAK